MVISRAERVETQDRRKVLKGLALGSGLVLGSGLARKAAAATQTGLSPKRGVTLHIDLVPNSGVSSTSTELVNGGDQTIVLNGFEPVTVRTPEGKVTVTLDTDGPLQLMPGERTVVRAKATGARVPHIANEYLAISTHRQLVHGSLSAVLA